MGKKHTNPKKIPRTQADVDRAEKKGQIFGMEFAVTLVLWILLDKHDAPDEDVQTLNEDKNLYLCYGLPRHKGVVFGDLRNTFLSIEPLHGPVDDLAYYAHSYGYQWVIVGAETGNRKDRIIPEVEWIKKIVKDCKLRNIPVFMKDSLISIIGEENMLRQFPWGAEI